MNVLTQKNREESDLFALDSLHPSASYLSGQQAAQTPGEKHIVFSLSGIFFAVSSKEVAEVVQVLSITPLPNVPDWLLGIADLRGRIISVVNPQKLFGMPKADLLTKTKFIVLKLQNIPSSVALAVDRLNEIIVLANHEFQPVENEETPYLLGKTIYKSNPLNLINVENLLSSLIV